MRTLIALFISCACCFSQPQFKFGSQANFAAPASGYTYVYQQDFETNAVIANWAGVGNYAYTPSLVGSFSLANTNGAPSTPVFTDSIDRAEVWVFFQNILGDPGSVWFRIRDNSSGGLIGVGLNANNMTVTCGGANGQTTGGTAFVAGTNYRFWFHYKQGTGANAVAEGWFSATDTIPLNTDTAHYCITSVGTTTTAARKYDFSHDFGSGTLTNIYDRFRISVSAIGSNPN